MGWEKTMKAAEAAKGQMVSDRSSGEKKFQQLLRQHQGDGMIFFQRGLAYEALGENALAIDDFKRAMAFFPKTEWKALAKAALQRVSHPHAVDLPVTKQNGQDKTRRVWVVHGRDERLRTGIFTFLRSIGLEPLEFLEARKLTGRPFPYVGEILDIAFEHAQAVVVLLTPDDEARLRPDLQSPADPPHERKLTGQARPNVLFEAGMSIVSHPKQTVLVQIGDVRPFSDTAGKHLVYMDGSSQKRQELASRLDDAGCSVNLKGIDWHTAGDLTARPKSRKSVSKPRNISSPEMSDIQQLQSQRVDDYAIRDRLKKSLEEQRFQWRTLKRLAIEAGISEDEAAELLRSDATVRFGKGKRGETVVGLRSRTK
jgi:predicted nucleotide-binding protein